MVAEAAEVEMSTVEKVENIALDIVMSMPLTTSTFEPALETMAVATPSPILLASTPSEVMARSS